MFRKKLISEVKNRFLLARHGESVWNHDSKFTGWTNIPLTDKGKEEATNMANVIKKNNLYPNIIFTSVLNRAIETSNIIRENLYNRSIPIQTSWRLNEKHYGTLEGVPRQYLRDNYGDIYTKKMRSNFNMKPPILTNYDNSSEYSVYRNCYFKRIKNGESKEDVLNRLLPYYENDILYTLSENKFPLIITHKHTARVLMKNLLKIKDDDFEHYDLPNKKLLLINLDQNLNYTDHEEISYYF
jgi:2,3-bisphosphoglycerate-dependent phosphoglycerate mutase